MLSDHEITSPARTGAIPQRDSVRVITPVSRLVVSLPPWPDLRGVAIEVDDSGAPVSFVIFGKVRQPPTFLKDFATFEGVKVRYEFQADEYEPLTESSHGRGGTKSA